MKMKKLTEIYEETSAYNTVDTYKELELAWRNLDNNQRFDLLLPFVKDPDDEPNMEWIEFWNKRPGIANNGDFQEALLNSVEQSEYDKGWYGESSDYADRLANSGTDSDGRNTWGDKTGYSELTSMYLSM